jgi:hypothetical protein
MAARSWTFTAAPSSALEALGEVLDADLSPRLYRELERAVEEAAAGLPPVPHSWTASLNGARVSLQVEPVPQPVTVAEPREEPAPAPSAFVDARHEVLS